MRRRAVELLEVVRRHDHRQPGVGVRESCERPEQDLATREVEAGTRLVEQEEARLPDERPRDEGALALTLRAVSEAPLRERAEAERSEQGVCAVDVEHAQPLLEVADRPCRPRSYDLAHGQHGGEPVAVACIDEPDLLAEAGGIGAPHRLAEDLDGAAARETGGCGKREERRLTGAVRAEQRPALAAPHRPRDVVEQGLACPARLMPAPHSYVARNARRRGVDRPWCLSLH